MKAGIFAAGMGSRFVQAGWKEPKPLIALHGKPLLGHVLERLFQAGIEEVELLLNEETFFDAVESYVNRLPEDFKVHVSRKTTCSSYESFRFLMERLGRPPFLLSTVDSMWRIASTAAWSTAFLSPRPCHLAAAIAAASVTRTSSRARFLSAGCFAIMVRAP